MKTIQIGILASALLLASVACKKEKEEDKVQPKATKGTLKMRTTVWSAFNDAVWKKEYNRSAGDTHTCELTNIRHFIPLIQVTTDEIKSGVLANSIKWTTIYESSQEMLHTDRVFEIALEPGKYKGIRIEQRNKMYWVCTFNGATIEFPSVNNSEIGADERIFNVFGEDGLYETNEEGKFVVNTNNEKLGFFEIFAGKTTRVSNRLNITALDWLDADGDGKWSPGDELIKWHTPEGVNTMSDFVVDYD